MKHIIFLLFTVALFSGRLVAQDSTVVDVIVASDDHETLEAAVIAADLATTLSGAGPFTVFAPTDAAFGLLPEGTLDFLLMPDNRDSLVSILTYHVVSGTVNSTDLMDGMLAATLNADDSLFVRVTDDGVMINNAMVTVADINTDNGVVHVIDAVLVQPPASVVDIIVNSEAHDTLEAAVIAAGLVNTLSGDGPFTVFAPVDEAFVGLPDGALDSLLADPMGDLATLLQYHVIAGKVFSTDLTDGLFVETLQGDSLFIRVSSGGAVTVNGSTVLVADLQADNGVVHAIDQVLMMPAATVVDIVVTDTTLSTLETAVTEAGLADTLSSEGPFTIFAPNNAAFAGLDDGALETLLADPTGDLATILQFHVVSGRFLSSDLTPELTLTTLQGDVLTIGTDAIGATVNEINIIRPDLTADNGVVHIINGVLMPEPSSAREPAFAPDVNIAPNPANEFTMVTLPENLVGKATLTLRDMNGRTIRQVSATTLRQRVMTGDLPTGTYLLEVRAPAGAIQRLIMVR